MSLKEALGFLRTRGVEVPAFIRWTVGRLRGETYEHTGLRNADAFYFRSDVGFHNADFLIRWDDLIAKGKVPVVVREEVFKSEEHVLYVFSHEIFEIGDLKREFEASAGAISLRRMTYLIDPDHDGVIHERAVKHADLLVRKLRIERGIER